jgi:phage FluMu protein Com
VTGACIVSRKCPSCRMISEAEFPLSQISSEAEFPASVRRGNRFTFAARTMLR